MKTLLKAHLRKTNNPLEMFEILLHEYYPTILKATGKTFIALYLAFSKMLKHEEYNKLLVIRSMVSTRDGGHWPGTKEEKE